MQRLNVHMFLDGERTRVELHTHESTTWGYSSDKATKRKREELSAYITNSNSREPEEVKLIET